MPATIANMVELVSAAIDARSTSDGRLHCALKQIVASMVLSPSSARNMTPAEDSNASISMLAHSALGKARNALSEKSALTLFC